MEQVYSLLGVGRVVSHLAQTHVGRDVLAVGVALSTHTHTTSDRHRHNTPEHTIVCFAVTLLRLAASVVGVIGARRPSQRGHAVANGSDSASPLLRLQLPVASLFLRAASFVLRTSHTYLRLRHHGVARHVARALSAVVRCSTGRASWPAELPATSFVRSEQFPRLLLDMGLDVARTPLGAWDVQQAGLMKAVVRRLGVMFVEARPHVGVYVAWWCYSPCMLCCL